MSDLKKSGKFYVRYDLDHGLDLDHVAIKLLKMGVNFQTNFFDLHINFKVMVKVKFKVVMTF